MDVMSKEQRSRCMSRIRAKDSKPEMIVRRVAHGLGYRHRLHRKDLPGKPDLVFPSRRKVIFVHGCFWHQHAGCPLASKPKTRPEYWEPKLAGNMARDRKAQAELNELGWAVLVIWECETKDIKAFAERLTLYLNKQS